MKVRLITESWPSVYVFALRAFELVEEVQMTRKEIEEAELILDAFEQLQTKLGALVSKTRAKKEVEKKWPI